MTKAELEEINQQLQSAIRIVQAENTQLRRENESLSGSLTQANEQLQSLTSRYQKLVDYVKSLREWATKNAA